MAYFKIGNTDYSSFVNSMKVEKEATYNAQTNAAGDTVVDYINHKRTIQVGIIPLDGESIKQLLADIEAFNVSISYRDPQSGVLVQGVNCIIPESNVEYYTIQAGKVMLKEFSLKFIEL